MHHLQYICQSQRILQSPIFQAGLVGLLAPISCGLHTCLPAVSFLSTWHLLVLRLLNRMFQCLSGIWWCCRLKLMVLPLPVEVQGWVLLMVRWAVEEQWHCELWGSLPEGSSVQVFLLRRQVRAFQPFGNRQSSCLQSLYFE